MLVDQCVLCIDLDGLGKAMNDQELVEIFSDMFDLVNLKSFLRQDIFHQNEIFLKFKNILKIKDPADLNKIMKSLPNFGFFKNIFSEYLWCTPRYAEKMGFENPEDLIGKSDLYLPWSFSMAMAYQEADELVLLASEASHRKEQWIIESLDLDNRDSEKNLTHKALNQSLNQSLNKSFNKSLNQDLKSEKSTKTIIASIHRYPVFDRQGHVIGVFGVGEEDIVSTQLARMAEISSDSKAMV
jgi:hypothetical protein